MHPLVHAMITGKTKHFFEEWAKTQVVTARHFLEAFDRLGEGSS